MRRRPNGSTDTEICTKDKHNVRRTMCADPPPHIAQSDGIAQTGQEELDRIVPIAALLILVHWANGGKGALAELPHASTNFMRCLRNACEWTENSDH